MFIFYFILFYNTEGDLIDVLVMIYIILILNPPGGPGTPSQPQISFSYIEIKK